MITTNCHFSDLTATIKDNKALLNDWLTEEESSVQIPFYTSVDIRDGGFKAAVVDTNIFPAGFNNLCSTRLAQSTDILQATITSHAPEAKNILIIAEEHTRNTWYLENARILQEFVRSAGYNVHTATFFDAAPVECDEGPYLDLETATGERLHLYCLKYFLECMKKDPHCVDLIILNNDLTSGHPGILKSLEMPVVPSAYLGWHSRLKSAHFREANALFNTLGEKIGIDPFFLSLEFTQKQDMDITNEDHREELAQAAQGLFDRIQSHYDRLGINEKPLLFLKADAGTYGMGVQPIESPDDIRQLNRKSRNKLSKGKSSQVITSYILQEGLPSQQRISDQAAEVCLYQLAGQTIGGFYRLNQQKNDRENLNSTGMSFAKMCAGGHNDGPCGVEEPACMPLYTLLARIHSIAAGKELSGKI